MNIETPHILMRAVFQCPSLECAREILALPIIDAYPWGVTLNPNDYTLTTCAFPDQTDILRSVATKYGVPLIIDDPLNLLDVLDAVEQS